MSRQVITKTVTVPASGGQVAKTFFAGQVVELSGSELTAVTTAGGTTRNTTSTTSRDQLGEAFGVSN